MDDVADQAKEANADFIVLYQDNTFARLRHYTENDRDRFKSKEVAIPELLETIVKLKLENDQSTTSAPSGSLMRIDSASRIPETPSVPQFSIEWSHMEKYLEDRKNAHLKKRLDASIRAKMLPILSSFVSSTDIQFFVLPFQGQVIRTLVANMDFEDDLKFNDCLKELIAKHSRHRKVSHFISRSKPIELVFCYQNCSDLL